MILLNPMLFNTDMYWVETPFNNADLSIQQVNAGLAFLVSPIKFVQLILSYH